MPASNLAKQLSSTPHRKKNPTDTLNNYYTEELVIALCGQLGTNLKEVSKELIDILKVEYHYDCLELKLSDYLFEEEAPESDEYKRIIKGMDLGDSIRKVKGNNHLASRAITDITLKRHEEISVESIDDRNYKSRRKCFIINSLKHPDELEAFQKVYGKSFYLLGVFSPDSARESYLRKIISKSDHKHIPTLIK